MAESSLHGNFATKTLSNVFTVHVQITEITIVITSTKQREKARGKTHASTKIPEVRKYAVEKRTRICVRIPFLALPWFLGIQNRFEKRLKYIKPIHIIHKLQTEHISIFFFYLLIVASDFLTNQRAAQIDWMLISR